MIKPFFKYSDWLILWFILSKFNIINYNPKFGILFAGLINLQTLFLLLAGKKKVDIKELIIFIFYILSKFIMFYLLLDVKFDLSNFIANIVVYLIYILWLYKIHNVNYFENIIKMCSGNKKEEKKYILQLYKNKLNNLNTFYLDRLQEINSNFKNKLIKSNYIINENDIIKIYEKYIRKLNKIKL
jgi:hypothetical protein